MKQTTFEIVRAQARKLLRYGGLAQAENLLDLGLVFGVECVQRSQSPRIISMLPMIPTTSATK